jgi:hypothetical protein
MHTARSIIDAAAKSCYVSQVEAALSTPAHDFASSRCLFLGFPSIIVPANGLPSLAK